MSLQRFLDAQAGSYERALRELRLGDKKSHWMWFVFPQLKGLGPSDKARFYGLDGLAEATAYLEHPVLGARLVEACEALQPHAGVGAEFVLGAVDAVKLRSCLTLFAEVPGAPPLFREMLAAFYGTPDARTLALLAG